MPLDKNELSQVERMFEKFEERIQKRIKQAESRIIATISREVTDLADINRAVIKRVDRIENLEKRMIRIETKLGIRPF